MPPQVRRSHRHWHRGEGSLEPAALKKLQVDVLECERAVLHAIAFDLIVNKPHTMLVDLVKGSVGKEPLRGKRAVGGRGFLLAFYCLGGLGERQGVWSQVSWAEYAFPPPLPLPPPPPHPRPPRSFPPPPFTTPPFPPRGGAPPLVCLPTSLLSSAPPAPPVAAARAQVKGALERGLVAGADKKAFGHQSMEFLRIAMRTRWTQEIRWLREPLALTRIAIAQKVRRPTVTAGSVSLPWGR